MAILSTFYDTSAGTPASLVTEVKWARSHPQIGSSEYGVNGAGDFKVTPHSSTPMAVNVAAGKAWGYGIWDESDSTVTVTCPAPSAGTSRWDLICVRRNWGPLAGGPTIVTFVTGGSSKAIPAGRNNAPGTLDDQPLALVKWTAGQSQPTSIVDLRCWARNGGMVARDDLALTYLKAPGSSVVINGTQWNCDLDANGNASWMTFKSGHTALTAVTNALYGSDPNGFGGQFLIQAGTNVNNTDGGGYARVTWPKTFPNGLLTVVAFNGDDWATGGTATFASSGNREFHGDAAWGDRSSWVYCMRAQDPNSKEIARLPAVNRIHRINWLAIGF